LAKHALTMNFALVNIVAVGLIVAAWIQGWLEGFSEPTIWIMSLGIATVFAWGLALCGVQIWRLELTNVDLDAGAPSANPTASEFLSAPADARPRKARIAQMRLGNQIGNLRHISNSLVFLGLIGTVVGFIIGLSGIDANAASDVNKVGAMITQLINGMSVALYTTLLGAVLNIWLNVNIRLLTTGAVQQLALMTELEGSDGAN
jgi:hypothetical protein